MREVSRSLRALYAVKRSSTTFVYMLQNVEYDPAAYLAWFWQTYNFATVLKRRTLDDTKAARILRFGSRLGMWAQLVLGLSAVWFGWYYSIEGLAWFGAALVVSYPIVWAHVLALVVAVGQLVFVRHRERAQFEEVYSMLSKHSGIRVAIAGSYGKTSMKELLTTVLGEGKRVAATPANMNVVSSHVTFVRSLKGDEDIVLIELGEGKPGDVRRFTQAIQPTHAVITGIAPAHLDQYGTVDAAAQDIFTVAEALEANHVFVNAESADAMKHIHPGFERYDGSGALGWSVEGATTSLEGTAFTLVKDGKRIKLHSALLGLHQVGPLAFAAAFALQQGLTPTEVRDGVAKTQPFEHRMQPYQLAGAWVIDDTYNGNLEGIKAGTALLKLLSAKRKLYVTPGLVGQGKDTAAIHRQVGQHIAEASPDIVVLMENSVTDHILQGLKEAGFEGEVSRQSDPLDFYQHLDHFVAAGDIVMMQNDWTDNYR